MRSPATYLILLLCGLICFNSCSEWRKELTDLRKLQQQLMDKYQEKEINVHLQNSGFLTITFINSPLNQQDAAKREARATHAAQFVVKNFSGIAQIKTMWIVFLASESRLILFHYSRSLNAYVFNNRGESVRQTVESYSSEENDEALSPHIDFDARRNETNISVMRIQLAGEPGRDGLALAPYFTATGDARGPMRSAVAPENVTFDFASYSHQKEFSSDVRLGIMCDRNPEFDTTARLLSTTDASTAGSYVQFLRAEIPFIQFAKMGEAAEVRLRLGEKQYQLKSDETAALKRLADLVRPPAKARR